MGVIINLKEIFAADGQEIFTDKINFNFNKLLELGIGEQGDQGIQGPVGAAGPPGIQGNDGQRGNRWFIGIGDPNTLVFTDLIIGDFYLETNDSSIWQYQGSPASWVQITDLSQVVINILEAEGQPFVRGFGEFSPLDDRFITFAKRGNDPTDITLDINLGNDSNNDTLLLTNWNERVTSISNFPTDTSDEYNSLQTISVDHTVNTLGRYHLEFGSLYESPASPGINELSSLNHNLKVRYLKDATTSINYPNSNEFINRARFSLTIPETGSPIDISEQGVFEFIAPKYNADGSPIKDNLTVRIGTTEPITETSYMDIAVDGLDISSNAKGVNLGLVRELETFSDVVTLTPDLNGDWGMLNISNNLVGLMLRGKTYHSDSVEVINTDGEFGPLTVHEGGITSVSSTAGYQSIFSDGKYLFAVSPESGSQESASAGGFFKAWDISDSDNPLEICSLYETSEWSTAVGPGPSYDLHGNPSEDGPFSGYNTPNDYVFNYSPLTGIRDVAFAGKYGVYIRRAPSVGIPANNFSYDSFFVFEMDSNYTTPSGSGSGFKILSWLGSDTTFSDFMIGSLLYEGNPIPPLDTARRVKISGNWAYVMASGEDVNYTDFSTLIAIDITNPTRPYVSPSNIYGTSNSRHIDFDIHGETAYILSLVYDAPNVQLSVIKVSIFDPNVLITTLNQKTVIDTKGSIPYTHAEGAIKVIGNRVYVVDKDGETMYIYEDNGNPTDPLTLISSTSLPTNYLPYDIEISGRYAYIYAYNNGTAGTILTYDISDHANPVLIEGYQDFTGTGSGTPSKMTIVGNKIFMISTIGPTALRGAVASVDINGINSPAAKIGNLHSKDIKVSNNLAVSQNLQVGRSAAIGSGGLWVDKGAGINTDSGINVNISNNANLSTFPINGIEVKSTGVEFLNSAEFTGMQIDLDDLTSDNNLAGYASSMNNIGTSAGFIIGRISGITQSVAPTVIGNYEIISNTLSDYTHGSKISILNSSTVNEMYGIEIDTSLNTVFGDLYGLKIDLDGNTVSGDTYGINITGSTLNILDGDLELDGNLSLSPGSNINGSVSQSSTTVLSVQLDEDIVASGFYTPTGINLLWQRVGNIVSVTGSRSHGTANAGGASAANHGKYPIIGPGGIVALANGHGTCTSVSSNLVDVFPVPATDEFKITEIGTGTAPTSGTSRFSFSYELI